MLAGEEEKLLPVESELWLGVIAASGTGVLKKACVIKIAWIITLQGGKDYKIISATIKQVVSKYKSRSIIICGTLYC